MQFYFLCVSVWIYALTTLQSQSPMQQISTPVRFTPRTTIPREVAGQRSERSLGLSLLSTAFCGWSFPVSHSPFFLLSADLAIPEY